MVINYNCATDSMWCCYEIESTVEIVHYFLKFNLQQVLRTKAEGILLLQESITGMASGPVTNVVPLRNV